MDEAHDEPNSSGEIGCATIGPFTVRWREHGPVDAPLMLLLHGVYAGASGYEWRSLVPFLATDHRVLVPDLIGFGISDRPDLEWSPDVLTGFVGAIIDAAQARAESAIDVVASSLTGAHTIRALATRSRPRGLTVITPTGLGRSQREPSGVVGRGLYAIGRHTPLGDAFVWALSSGPSVRWFQRHETYHDPGFLTEQEVVETRHVARLVNAKHAQLAFVANRLAISLDAEEVRRLAPSVIWGSGQGFVDASDAERWTEAGADVTVLPDGLPQVESPAATARLVREG